MALGKRLQQARKYAKVSIEKLSKNTGIPALQILNMETHDVPTSPFIFEFSQALKCNVEWLETGAMVRPFGASRDFFEDRK